MSATTKGIDLGGTCCFVYSQSPLCCTDEWQVLLICLDSLRVDTTTAAPVAAAAQELAQEALATDLLTALRTRGPSLGPLLQLYLAALRCNDCQTRAGFITH